MWFDSRKRPHPAVVSLPAYMSELAPWVKLVNLRNRTGEERRRPTLCDKRDDNFFLNNFSPNFTFF